MKVQISCPGLDMTGVDQNALIELINNSPDKKLDLKKLFDSGIISLFNILPNEIQTKKGKISKNDLKTKSNIFGIYFSAHWCPPCRAFTPHLAEKYKKMKEIEPNFEIIFASSDNDEKSYKEYYNTMPWATLGFKSPHIGMLSVYFKVRGIPTLLIFNSQGTLIDSEARGTVVSNDAAKCISQWKSKA